MSLATSSDLAQQNVNRDRAWMLVVMESDQDYDNKPYDIDNGGWCIGFQVHPVTKHWNTMFFPCIVEAGGKRATPGSDTVAWNPNGLWLAQDDAAQNNHPFILTSIDGQFSLNAIEHADADNSWNTDFGRHHISADLSISRDNHNPSWWVADKVAQNPYIYMNVNQISISGTNGHLGAVGYPGEIYYQAAKEGDAFNASKLPGVAQAFTFQGMQGGQLLNGKPWVQIRSVPYYAQATTTLGQANNACAFENPDDISAIPKNKTSTLFCCGDGANAKYTVFQSNNPFQVSVATCQNMTFAHYLAMLKSPPPSIYPGMANTSQCKPGTYGPGCLLTCPSGFTAPNCGCLRGLTPQSDGTCSMRSASSCKTLLGMKGVNILTGQCACPPGLFGINCEQSLSGNSSSSPFQKYFKPLAVAGGIFGILALIWLLISPSSDSKTNKTAKPGKPISLSSPSSNTMTNTSGSTISSSGTKKPPSSHT